MSAAVAEAITRSFVMHTRVESWLGEEILAVDVPVSAGTLDVDRSLRVPERVTLTVPRLDRGATWDPQADYEHPLACWGQRLKVSIGIETSSGAIEWLTLGWYLVNAATTDGDTVTVEAVGLLQLIDEARFVTPFQPTGTFEETLRALVEPALTVDVDPAVSDRSIAGRRVSWDEDRLGAVFELLDAWPADAAVTPDGFLSVTSANAVLTEPVLWLTDGVGGTVVRWTGGASRSGASSWIVVRGQSADGTPIDQAVRVPYGPARHGGLFNPLPVPYFHFSPLVNSRAEAGAVAVSLVRRRRRITREVTAAVVPHPGLQVGDRVAVTSESLDGARCIVESLSMPLVADGGAMTLGLQVLPS